MSILTTIDALNIATQSVELRTDIPKQTKKEALKKLNKLKERDWYNNWSKDTIIERLKQFVEENGRIPTVIDLKEHGMPNALTIQTYFHAKPSVVLNEIFSDKKYLPLKLKSRKGKYPYKEIKEWISCFVEQFEKFKNENLSQTNYDLLRDEYTPAWRTIARHCGVKSWDELIGISGVQIPPSRNITYHHLQINRTESPTLHTFEELHRKQEELNKELKTVLSSAKK